MNITTKLICPDCRHENEQERIYCHGCGARLSKPTAAAVKDEEAKTIETREHLRRMMDNRGVVARAWAVNIFKLLVVSCIAAAGIVMLLAPDLPIPNSKDLELGPQIGLDLEDAILQHRGARLTYSQDQVNSYIGNLLKRKKTTVLDKPMLEFRRGVAQFSEGTFRMTLERSLFGLSIYVSGAYRANAQDGKIATANEGGAIGRMPIHPQVMHYATFLLSDAWKAMEQDRKQVEKCAAIEFHPKMVVLTAPLH